MHRSVVTPELYVLSTSTVFLTEIFLYSPSSCRNDGQTDRYSVLMTFDSQQFADDFYQHYNLKPFSSLEVSASLAIHFVMEESMCLIRCLNTLAVYLIVTKEREYSWL